MARAPIAALFAALVAVPVAATAQTSAGAFNYYTPPKLATRGVPKSPIAGSGTVVIKVLVDKNGTAKVQGIIRSTNHEDDKAALEIAASSTYHPATRGKTKETAFYDFTLKFTGNAQVSAGVDTSELEQDHRMMGAGNYSGARTALLTYVAAHPDDAKGQLYLGVADVFLAKAGEAAAAFDKAGAIPVEDRATAAKAYADAAVDAITAKDPARGLALAKKSVELAPTYDKYSVLGYANLSIPDVPAAIVAFEKARDLSKSENATAKQRALTETYLVSAYAQNGDLDKAKAATLDADSLDASSNADSILENFYVKHGDALSSAGKAAEAGAFYEQAAVALPKSAGPFYSRAALAYLRVKPDPANGGKVDPNNAKAEADADKALAVDPNSAVALFAKGVSLANMDKSKSKDALDYLKKADDQAKKGNDPSLTSAIEAAIKQLNGGK